jgi:hypothetical protein
MVALKLHVKDRLTAEGLLPAPGAMRPLTTASANSRLNPK